jgi:hypothetical protein
MDTDVNTVVHSLFELLNYSRPEDERAREAGMNEDVEVFAHAFPGPYEEPPVQSLLAFADR